MKSDSESRNDGQPENSVHPAARPYPPHTQKKKKKKKNLYAGE